MTMTAPTTATDNMSLWNQVCKTNPAHTKPAQIGGMKITAIAPMYQIQQATEQWGPYGSVWGLKSIDRDFQLVTTLNLVIFSGVFFFPGGEFEISTSAGIYRDNNNTKVDKDFCKKMETDLLTKALSKVGFNADVFMGRFDDVRYVADMREEFSKPQTISNDQAEQIRAFITAKNISEQWAVSQWQLGAVSELHADNFQKFMDWIDSQQPVQERTTEKKPEQPPAERNLFEQPVRNEQQQQEHIEFMRKANEYRKKEKEQQKAQQWRERQQADNSQAQDDKPNQPSHQNIMNVVSGVKTAHMNRFHEQQKQFGNPKKIQPSGQVLNPSQFKNLKNALQVSGETEQWLLKRMQVDKIGKIDSAYYPALMAHLKKCSDRKQPQTTVDISYLQPEQTQYQRRTEMYQNISEHGAYH